MNKKQLIKNIFIAIILVLIDQISKLAVTNKLEGQTDIILIKGVLQLHYLRNTGAAFSILTGKMAFFYLITPIFCACIIYIMFKLGTDKISVIVNYLLLFILSGAIGNYIDRVVNKFVTDFIYFSLIDFPVFNVADIYVTCGTFILAFVMIFFVNEEQFDNFTKKLFNKKNERIDK